MLRLVENLRYFQNTTILIKKLISNNLKYITAFGLIYEYNNQIRIYQIGTLITKPTKTSYKISNINIYRGEAATQQIEFLKRPISIKYDIHIIHDSKTYFNTKDIRNKIKETDPYKQLYNNVIQELKDKNIRDYIRDIK